MNIKKSLDMKTMLPVILMLFVLGACSNKPEPPPKFHFSSSDEMNDYYLPLQDKHGGIKHWWPSRDPDCKGGKNFVHGDWFISIWCPKDGNNDLFK